MLIKKIKKLIRNKDIKNLIENFISLSALQLVSMLLPLITLPYILRVLGFTNYGTIILASSLVTYFQSVTDYSFRITATRDVAIFRHSQVKLNLIFSKVLIVKSIFLLSSILILTSIILLYPPFYEERIVFFLTVTSLLGYALFPEWFFQGIEKMKYITILNLFVKLFFTICVFVFIKTKEDYWLYPLLLSSGSVVAAIVGQFILMNKFNIKFIWIKPRMIKQTIISNFSIFVNQFAPNLYNNTSSFLLGIIGGNFWLGIYDAIQRVINVCVALINIISRVFFPFLNRKKDFFNNYKKIMFLSSIFLILIVLVSHKLFFWYLNIEYEKAFYVLFILAISLIGNTLYDIFGLNYFIIRRQDKLVMKNTITASLLGFISAAPLIYFFGIFGAAFNLCFSRWMMGGRLYLKYLKNK